MSGRILWALWIIGWIITFIAGGSIRHYEGKRWDYRWGGIDIVSKFSCEKIIMIILTLVSIFIVGGMTVGSICGDEMNRSGPDGAFAICVFGVPLTWLVGYLVLGFGALTRRSKYIFFAFFIASVAFWGMFFNGYFSKIEEVTKTTRDPEIEREEVVYFRLEESVINYLYLDDKGHAVPDHVSVDGEITITPITEGESYVEITTYHDVTKSVNHNTGEEREIGEQNRKKYEFFINVNDMR